MPHDNITEANDMSQIRLAHINECGVKMGPRKTCQLSGTFFIPALPHTILS